MNSNYRYRFLDNQTTRTGQSDYKKMFGFAGVQTHCRDRPRLKCRVGLYGRQHSKEDFPSCAMNDIATDVAAAIQIKRAASLPRSLPATPKRARNALQR